MKKIYFLLLGLCVGMLVSAAPVNPSRAQQIAQNFMQNRFGMKSHKMKRAMRLPLTSENMKGQAPFYVFNISDNDGFVIVSGDDRAPAILGYSAEGSIDTARLPENLKDLFDSYEQQIAVLSTMADIPYTQKMKARAPKPTKHSIRPLVPSRWDQGLPYYNQTPMVNGEHTATGCAATAMAQIMYFHKYPQGPIQKSIPSYQSDAIHTTMPELPITTFKWNEMSDTYASDATADPCAVSELMLYCGQALEMNYNLGSKGGSGALSRRFYPAFVEYFGYDAGLQLVSRSEYSYDDWNDLIYNELANNRPVLYSGVTSINGGHAFVCDGYASGEYFHINWGWHGRSDGYFLLSVLFPEIQGTGGSMGNGFGLDQEAVIGIQRPNGGTKPFIALNIYEMSATSYTNTFTRTNSSANFTGSAPCMRFYNRKGATALNYEVGLALYKDGAFVAEITHYPAETYENGGSVYKKMSGDVSFGAGLLLGTYKVYPVCRESGASEWHLMADALKNNKLSFNAEITETQCKLSQSSSSLAVLGSEQREDIYSDKDLKIYVTVKNTGEDFSGPLTLRYKTTNLDAIATIKGGTTAKVLFSGKAPYVTSETTYNFTVKDKLNDVQIGSGLFTVKVKSGGDAELKGPTTIDGVNGRTFYGNTITGKVTLTNKQQTPATDVDVTVAAFDYSKQNGTSDSPMATMRTKISAEGGATVAFPFTLTGFVPGKQYKVYALINGDTTTPGWFDDPYTCAPGITMVDTSGETKSVSSASSIDCQAMDAVDFTSANIATLGTITPSSNPNCLYYFPAGVTVPSELNGCNVVVGDYADNISLTDGNNFLAIYDFTATNISYTRTFANGNNGTGESNWETIVLPFDVKSIMDGTKSLQWFKSKSEKNKNLWIMDFRQEDGNKVLYGYTDQLLANTPYIIAVPAASSKWPNSWILTGKAITFVGENAEVATSVPCSQIGNNHVFTGTYKPLSNGTYYVLDQAANAFVKTTSAQVLPFHAYFDIINPSAPNLAKALVIGSIDDEDSTTAIEVVENTGDESAAIYNLMGVKVGNGKADLKRLPKGIYIIGNRKVTN